MGLNILLCDPAATAGPVTCRRSRLCSRAMRRTSGTVARYCRNLLYFRGLDGAGGGGGATGGAAGGGGGAATGRATG